MKFQIKAIRHGHCDYQILTNIRDSLVDIYYDLEIFIDSIAGNRERTTITIQSENPADSEESSEGWIHCHRICNDAHGTPRFYAERTFAFRFRVCEKYLVKFFGKVPDEFWAKVEN